jgi:hypothetical protein
MESENIPVHPVGVSFKCCPRAPGCGAASVFSASIPQPLQPCLSLPLQDNVADGVIASMLPPWAVLVALFSLIVKIEVLWSSYYRSSFFCFNCDHACFNPDNLSSILL